MLPVGLSNATFNVIGDCANAEEPKLANSNSVDSTLFIPIFIFSTIIYYFRFYTSFNSTNRVTRHDNPIKISCYINSNTITENAGMSTSMVPFTTFALLYTTGAIVAGFLKEL